MRLTRLRVLRTPGLNVPFTLEPEPGLNLITGPNGVGKSSVCRAVLSLLWPKLVGEEPFEAEAEFSVDGDTLRVSRRDSETPLWASGTRPNLGADHLAGRHLLGVLDLLAPAAEGDPLAKEIRQQMAGGFDLGDLRSALFPTGTGRSENQELKKAEAEVVRLRGEQRSLSHEQADLDELAAEVELAQTARQRQAALEILGSLIREAAALAAADRALAGMPTACASVRPDDPEQLMSLRNQAEDRRREILAREAAREKAREEKKTLIAGGGLDADLAPELLRKKTTDLVELRRDLRLAEREAGGPELDETLAEAVVKPSPWPVISLAAAGAALIAAGIFWPDPVPYLDLVLMLLGGTAFGAGILAWRGYTRNADRSRLALEQETRLAAARDHMNRCRGQLNDALLDFNATLATGGLDEVSDIDEASHLLDDLSERRQRLSVLEGELGNHEEILARERAELDRVSRDSTAIRKRLDLASAADPATEAARLLELAPRFEKTRQERDDASRQIERLGKQLTENSSRLRADETLDISEALLADRIATEAARTANYDTLVKTVADIEARIEVTSRGSDLQEALAVVESRRGALAEVRGANREAALGNLLLDRVQQQHEKESRPLVLEKADALFHLFTGRTHHLEMASGAEGDRFVARAEHAVRPLELDELSDGTRAQLLLAVKLAFMTVNEDGVHAPIFLDDSLTSADPVRFAAVVDSLARLAADQQRQIFYLTPNPADAAAIGRALAKTGHPQAHHLDLAQIRGLAAAADPILLDPANLPEMPVAPDPGNLSAAEYGAALLVPRPDPWKSHGLLHVFHVMKDELQLVRRLVDAGAATVGRFASARETLLAAGIISAQEAARVAAAADVWSAWLDGWRLGRAKPVTRDFLVRSGAVSDKFIDLVTEALEKCGGDGAGLLAAIENKEVKGFRANKLEELREDLAEDGLLAHGEPMTGEELVAHTRDRVTAQLAAGLLDMQKVRTLALTFAQLIPVAEPEIND